MGGDTLCVEGGNLMDATTIDALIVTMEDAMEYMMGIDTTEEERRNAIVADMVYFMCILKRLA